MANIGRALKQTALEKCLYVSLRDAIANRSGLPGSRLKNEVFFQKLKAENKIDQRKTLGIEL